MISLFVSLASAMPASAGCVASLVQAAIRHGVPPDLMLALGHAESGWKAYAVNSAGTSHFPETEAAAVTLVRTEQARGVKSIDVGCGQINLRWHPDAFDDLVEAFDPDANSEYAARFLADLKVAHGDWPAAVARYHSSDPDAQQAYVDRIYQRLTILQDGSPPDYFRPGTVPRQHIVDAPNPDAPRSVRPRIVGVPSSALPVDAGGRVIRVPGLR